MTVALRERPGLLASGRSPAPARRAMIRWAWRLFRREWRQQILIMALLIVALAATIVGLGVASNAANLKADPTFGTANSILTFPGSDPDIAGDIVAIRRHFGTIDVISHQSIAIPGSISAVDVRAQDPNGPYGRAILRLDSGRYPRAAGEVAVTNGVAKTFGLHVGRAWIEGGRTLEVVGLIENPLNLLDQFALVAPGRDNPPASVSVLVNASQGALNSFRLPSGAGLDASSRGTSSETANEAIILVLGSLGLLFVGLMGVAGFTVMAQRRLRALGIVGALGATDRQVRLVMLANGAVVGMASALAGAVIGLAAWMAFAPTLQSIAEHRVDPFSLPWWAIAVAALLTVVTAVAAAWWPARAMARLPVMAALSGRPPRPQPSRRFATLGSVLLGGGLVLLAFADRNRAGFIIGGTVTTAVGLLLLAPVAIRALAAGVGRRAAISVRLALRDLARYQARSGAALGAVTLAIGIAATIAVSASAAEKPTGPGNLPANQIMLYLTAAGAGNPVPAPSASQAQTLSTDVSRLGAAIDANLVLPLEQAYDPRSTLVPEPNGSGSTQQVQPGCGSCANGQQRTGYLTATLAKVTQMSRGEQVDHMTSLYVATPTVLTHYGIDADQINPTSDVVSSRRDLGGLQVFDPSVRATPTSTRTSGMAHPTLQLIDHLPTYTSDPGTLITPAAMRTLGLQPLPAGWLIQTPHPLTAAQIATARKAAAGAGLYVETRSAKKSTAPLRNWSTAAGILLALGVLGMTVGLIRSETANDLRTLAATGASSSTRRTLTGATAGALALLGALLGTAGAYAALLAWHRSDLTPLGRVPVVDLIVILVGLPLVAFAGGWLLAGRPPSVVARQALE